MANIVVSALLRQEEQALLAQKPSGDWELPSDELGEHETTDDAAGRILRQLLAIHPETVEFLDTYYERESNTGEPIIRSVYCINRWSGQPQVETGKYLQIRWIGLESIDELLTNGTHRAILRDCLCNSSNGAPGGAPITVITGPRGAGKSTIAGLLCTRLQRAAHIEVDLLRDMVIAGPETSNDIDDRLDVNEVVRLAVGNACSLARNFSLSGYEAIIDDVIESPNTLNLFLSALSGTAPVYFVTLLPDGETLESRDATREPELRMGSKCLDMLMRFHRNGETRGLRLDTSRMSRSETVSWILANRDRARVL